MLWLNSVSQWLTGNGRYMTLVHCMGHDWLFIYLTVGLDILVAAGYAVITYHWWKNQRILPPCPARSALGTMRNIFIFCCICGYVFIPVKMFWPAWRLYDCFLAGLVFFTWRYAWRARDLKVIYSAIGRSNQLAEDLLVSREESKRKSFFLNAVSHDLRTPLNGMLLHADLADLHSQDGDAASLRESIQEIKSCVRMTSDLLDGLLECARLDSAAEKINNSDFELDQLLRDLLNAHAAVANRKGLDLIGNPNTKIILHTDRLKLERILNNLLSNAIKFTVAGSIRIEVLRAKENVEIHVIDTGVGIAPEHVGRLFEEFFQVANHERDRQKGFGLGLAISRRLARQMGADLLVESSLGHGSRFTIVLPDTARTARSEPVSAEQSVKSVDLDESSASAVSGG